MRLAAPDPAGPPGMTSHHFAEEKVPEDISSPDGCTKCHTAATEAWAHIISGLLDSAASAAEPLVYLAVCRAGLVTGRLQALQEERWLRTPEGYLAWKRRAGISALQGPHPPPSSCSGGTSGSG